MLVLSPTGTETLLGVGELLSSSSSAAWAWAPATPAQSATVAAARVTKRRQATSRLMVSSDKRWQYIGVACARGGGAAKHDARPLLSSVASDVAAAAAVG